MQTPQYEVIVRGRLGPALVSAFDGLSVLERIESLGLELLDVRRI